MAEETNDGLGTKAETRARRDLGRAVQWRRLSSTPVAMRRARARAIEGRLEDRRRRGLVGLQVAHGAEEEAVGGRDFCEHGDGWVGQFSFSPFSVLFPSCVQFLILIISLFESQIPFFFFLLISLGRFEGWEHGLFLGARDGD